MSAPTEEGLRRYRHSQGYYNASYVEATACTCQASCDNPCAGECGCEGCSIRFQEFYSDVPQFIKPDMTVDEERALRAYRFGDWSE